MAYAYRGGDRTQGFLLPPDVRDWLPEDHVAWLVLDLVESIDTSAFHTRSRRGGVGRAGFDPDVLLGLLIYAYVVGERSSRRIEQLCHTDVAFRVITGNEAPDHTVIARFRQAHENEVGEVFTQLLGVCAGQGMCRVGAIALDGTKIAANASRQKNLTREQLREQVDRIVAEAAEVDRAEDLEFGGNRGDELPHSLRAGSERLERLRACLEDLDTTHPEGEATQRLKNARQRVDTLRAEVSEMESQRAAYEADKKAGKRGHGPFRPRPPGVDPPPTPSQLREKRQALANAEARLQEREQRPTVSTKAGNAPSRNPTDPDSRVMRSQGGWVQGYNAQAAVSADGLIVACEVTSNVNDNTVFSTMVDQTRNNLQTAGVAEPVRAMLADAGYYSNDNLTIDGPPRLIPPHRSHNSELAEGMRRRLEHPAMASLYRRRLRAEQAFGRIKHNQGFRQFSRRGLDAVRSEWNLMAIAHNVRALHRHVTIHRHPPHDESR